MQKPKNEYGPEPGGEIRLSAIRGFTSPGTLNNREQAGGESAKFYIT